jgi:hypothetical protein
LPGVVDLMAGHRLTVEIAQHRDTGVRPTQRAARPVRRGERTLREYELAATELARFVEMQRYVRSLAVALERRDADTSARLLREAHQDLHQIGRALRAELGRPRPGATR